MKQRFANQLLLVRHNAVINLRKFDLTLHQRLANGGTTRVRALTGGGFITDGHNCQTNHRRTNSPLLPPALSRSSISEMRMPRSTALHMSYTVNAATDTAVKASISTPV